MITFTTYKTISALNTAISANKLASGNLATKIAMKDAQQGANFKAHREIFKADDKSVTDSINALKELEGYGKAAQQRFMQLVGFVERFNVYFSLEAVKELTKAKLENIGYLEGIVSASEEIDREVITAVELQDLWASFQPAETTAEETETEETETEAPVEDGLQVLFNTIRQAKTDNDKVSYMAALLKLQELMPA